MFSLTDDGRLFLSLQVFIPNKVYQFRCGDCAVSDKLDDRVYRIAITNVQRLQLQKNLNVNYMNICLLKRPRIHFNCKTTSYITTSTSVQHEEKIYKNLRLEYEADKA